MKTHAIIASFLTLAACGSEDTASEPPMAAQSEADTGPVEPDDGTVTDPEDTAIADVIPSKFRGRWGLVAADCEPGRSDAKGLVEIGPKTMKFYESLAMIDKVTSVSGDQMTGDFDFEGEGQQWERIVMLRLDNDGKTLIRTEPKLDLPAQYTRC